MKIALNLATRPYADQGPALKRLRIGMAVLAGVLVLLGVGMLHFHQAALAMAAREATVDRSVNLVQQEQLGYQRQMQQPANAKVLTQAQFLNGLFDEKSFSWTAAMEELERVLPGGVQVTMLEPSRGKDGRLTLKLRVSGQRQRAVEMVRNMERSKRFADPRVSGENSENNAGQGGFGQGGFQQVQDTGRVSFDILSEYNPATLEERKTEIAAQRGKHAGAEAVQPPQTPAMPAAMAPGVRRGYVPPNSMPGRSFPGQQPPMRTPRPNGGQSMNQPQEQEIPSGYDPSGLKNHDRNRIPPPGANPPNVSPGGPQ
jgi:type IV pilus assembly protein PilN